MLSKRGVHCLIVFHSSREGGYGTAATCTTSDWHFNSRPREGGDSKNCPFQKPFLLQTAHLPGKSS